MSQKGKRILKYFSHTLEGNDDKLSGKRVLGTILVLCGIHIGWYGVSQIPDHLDAVSILVGAFFGAGISFWGITSWTTMQEMKMNTTVDTKQVVSSTDTSKVVVDSKTISTDKKVDPPENG